MREGERVVLPLLRGKGRPGPMVLTWEQHPLHVSASRWYASLDDSTLLFCRFTMLGFLRLLTNRQVMGDSTTTVDGAIQLYDRWRQDPRVALAGEPRGTEGLFRQALAPHSRQSATKAVADCYLAGFAEAAGARLVTFDRGLAATVQFQQVPVTLLEPIVINGGSPAFGEVQAPWPNSRLVANAVRLTDRARTGRLPGGHADTDFPCLNLTSQALASGEVISHQPGALLNPAALPVGNMG